MTWILILIIMSSEGSAVTHVPGFATKQHCDAAATRIKALDNELFTRYRITCVATGPTPSAPVKVPAGFKAEKE